MVVADEEKASQRPVTRPSILLSTHSNTSPRSWIHSYSHDPSIWSVRRPYYKHQYLHKNLHSDRIILHALKQQPT